MKKTLNNSAPSLVLLTKFNDTKRKMFKVFFLNMQFFFNILLFNNLF